MLTITSRITLNDSAGQWELYSSHPEAEDVARDINAAIETAVNRGASRDDVERAAAKVMCTHAKHGAYDSEPCGHLQDLLDRIFPATDN